MKLFISLSANSLTGGQRVAVEFDTDVWYLGTVVKETATGHRVEMDFGGAQVIKQAVRIWPVDRKARRKTSITLADVKLIKSKPQTKLKPVDKTTKKPSVHTPETPKVDPRAQPEPHAHVPRASHSEHTLAASLGSASMFEACKEGSASQIKTARIKYIKTVWHKANAKFFKSEMREPTNIKLHKETKAVRSLGYWRHTRDGSLRELSVSPRAFNSEEYVTLTLIVHEMCHQAVAEIDNVYDRTAGGHGPNWQAWMRHCGLEPNRYVGQDYLNHFRTEEERKEEARRVQNRQIALQNTTAKPLRVSELRENLPVQYYNSKSDTWFKGLLIGKHDVAGKFWCVLREPKPEWAIVPNSILHELPTDNHAQYTSDLFLHYAEVIREHKRKKLEQLRQRRKS